MFQPKWINGFKHLINIKMTVAIAILTASGIISFLHGVLTAKEID